MDDLLESLEASGYYADYADDGVVMITSKFLGLVFANLCRQIVRL